MEEIVHVIEDWDEVPWDPLDTSSDSSLSEVMDLEALNICVKGLKKSTSTLSCSEMELLRSLPFPMHVLAKSGGPVATMEYFQQEGWSVNSLDRNNFTPLHYAAKYGKFKVLKYLCCKSDLSAKTSTGETALLLAAQMGHINIVELLFNWGADIVSCNSNKRCLLHYACERGWSHIVKLCLNLKCDINMKTDNLSTPLLLAAAAGNKELVKLLIERGADVHLADSNNYTILHYAANENWFDIAQLCLNLDCDINAQTFFLRTPSLLAAENSYTDLLEFFVSCGADPSIYDDQEWNVLHWAAFRGWGQVLLKFIETCSGSNNDRIALLNNKNHEGDTPLYIAVFYKHAEIVKILLEAGADCNLENNIPETAFQQFLCNPVVSRPEHFPEVEVVILFLRYGGLVVDKEFLWICRNPIFKERILKDSELCSISIINKFNHKYLPLIYKLPGFEGNLPLIERLQIKMMQNVAHDIIKSVDNEIQAKGFWDMYNSKRPMVLKMLCVKFLINHYLILNKQSEYASGDKFYF